MNQILIAFLLIIGFSVSAQDTNALLNKGNQYYQLSQYDLAEKQFRKAIEKNPNNTIAIYNLSNTLQREKKYDESIQLLNDLIPSIKETELKSFAFYNKGVAYSNTRQLEPSIEAYKEALRLNPQDKDARENLQKALLELKKQQQQKKNQDKQNQQQPKMNQKEAEQKLKLLEQKERNLQQRLQNKSSQNGNPQKEDW